LPDLHSSDVAALENWMDEMDQSLAALTAFILPGGHHTSAHAHVARCICRRAERIIVSLDEIEGVAPLILAYINRLSDYLFVLSRKLNSLQGAKEQHWRPRN